jgi:16S rRNA processing protein RimM
VTEFVAVGRVGRPHGLDGLFVVELASEDPRRYEPGATLYVDGEPCRVVASRRAGGGRTAIKLDRPVERGQSLAVRRDELPPPAPGSYYVFQLIGLEAVTADGRSLGRVKDVHPGVTNDNLELESGVLVPMIEEAIPAVDLDTGRVVLNPDFTV